MTLNVKGAGRLEQMNNDLQNSILDFVVVVVVAAAQHLYDTEIPGNAYSRFGKIKKNLKPPEGRRRAEYSCAEGCSLQVTAQPP